LFIDASNDFEKVGNQNKLSPDNIAKIIETYRERKTIDKYSYLANIDEVKENDYNLNIPRYVDTFEEEEAIDLKAVSKELREVAEVLEATDKSIADFCKQLNIETPF
jgi:type I restriction enzyme M protein